MKHDAAAVSSAGALITSSAAKTGRSPKDKRIVETPDCVNDVWWGDVNIKLSEASFNANRQRAIDYLNSRDELFVIDGFAGWDVERRIKVRVICARSYHALFMHNMLVRPTVKELENFGQPDYVILNAGEFPADPATEGLTSSTSVNLNLAKRELVILGTQYAGEMKKGVFTIMNYLMPKAGILSMHCSANEGVNGDVSLFFGLSGTGKTTLSTEANRHLIGDDEHCWTDLGVFNIEGGCYAKCIDLSKESEPEIYNAIRFGTVLENVVQAVFDAYDKNDFQTASERLGGLTFSLRVTGRGGGDWTINQNNGRIGIYQGLSSFTDVPLMSMNTDTFNQLQTSSDSDLFWNVSWENAPVEFKAKAVQALREIKSKVADAK